MKRLGRFFAGIGVMCILTIPITFVTFMLAGKNNDWDTAKNFLTITLLLVGAAIISAFAVKYLNPGLYARMYRR